MYNHSNSLGDRVMEGRGSERRHAGTGEGISAELHLANSHGDKAEEDVRSDRRHSANSLWERDDSCMSVGASIVVAGVGVGYVGVGVCLAPEGWRAQSWIVRQGTARKSKSTDQWAQPLTESP